MTWFDALRELCSHIECDTCIREILNTGVEEDMITYAEAKKIAHAVGTVYRDRED